MTRRGLFTRYVPTKPYALRGERKEHWTRAKKCTREQVNPARRAPAQHHTARTFSIVVSAPAGMIENNIITIAVVMRKELGRTELGLPWLVFEL